jgi:hypothetical protein
MELGKAQHVVILISWDGKSGNTVGANGGDQRVKTVEDARARNASVSIVNYKNVRRDFLGFATLFNKN